MDWLTFWDHLIKSLTTMIGAFAWPAAVVVAAWLFKDKLMELLPLLNVEHKGTRLWFGEKLAAVGEEVAAAERAVEEVPKQESNEQVEKKSAREEKRLDSVALISPRQAIVEGFEQLEKATRKLAIAAGTDDEYLMDMWTIVRKLVAMKVISETTAGALSNLDVMRTKAIRSRKEMDPDQALGYIKLALRLSAQLDILARWYAKQKKSSPATP